MMKKIIPVSTIASLCLLIILLNVTTPASAGPFGILAIFIFAYLLFIGLITYFIYLFSRIASHLAKAFAIKRPLESLSLKRSYYLSTIIASAPIMLIALQSVGAGSIYGFILVLIFVVIGCLYISKRIH